MKHSILITITAIILTQNGCKQNTTPDYPLHGIPLQTIEITDAFWGNRFNLNSHTTVPDVLHKCEEYGRVQNFAVAAGEQNGNFIGGQSWDDSDMFKALEAASYQYALYKDENLRHYMDSIINLMAKAQEEDGYLVTVMKIRGEKKLPWNIRSPRFSYMIWSHELYNFGHLYEAAAAHYQATGQKNLLNIATKNADLLVRTFMKGDCLNTMVDGHPEVETGLVRLWKATGKEDYLHLAAKLLDLRGDSSLHKLYLSYDEGRNPYFFQDYKPVKQFDKAYGHGVRALYLYASMADVGTHLADTDYFIALDKLWNNIIKHKMYVTGGIGSRHKGEAFGENYELPNFSAYNETCSSIANILWNYKMHLHSGQSKYMDVCERILYNAFLAGWALNGTDYNYVNPLESDGEYKYNKGANSRQPWFETSCCPTNISRFVPQIREMIYSTDNNSIFVNLFIAGKTKIPVNGNTIGITMQGNYPWSEDIDLTIDPQKETSFPLCIRIPSWVNGSPLPESGLYNYAGGQSTPVTITLNGTKLTTYSVVDGYAVINRKWEKGDKVSINLPMPVRIVEADCRLEDNRNKVAIEKGPVVYCAEQYDNTSNAENWTVDTSSIPEVIYQPEKLGGIDEIRYNELTLIPYYAWGNRGANKMKVWINLSN